MDGPPVTAARSVEKRIMHFRRTSSPNNILKSPDEESLYNEGIRRKMDAMHTKPFQKLEIKKDQNWELWLVSPLKRTKLGSFTSLDELNQVQITLYRAWEKARYPRDCFPTLVKH